MPSAQTCPAERKAAIRLGPLRRQLGLSQLELADRLNVSQPCIAQLENKEDMYVTTLRRHLKALGGELQLLVHFPGHSTEIVLTVSAIESTKPNQPTSGRTSC